MSLPNSSLSFFLAASLASLVASSHGSLAAFSASLMMPSQTFFRGRVSEHHRAEHDVFAKFLGFGFDHHHGVERAGDDEVEFAFLDLGVGRVEDIFAVLVADARGADRTHERNAAEAERGRRGAHGDDVGLILAVVGKDLRDHEDFIVEAVREQRADRAIDQAAGQRFLFGGAALTLEEAARDTPGGREFFLVVDGQREEVLPRLDALGGGHRAEDDGLAQGRDYRAIGLARNAAGFELQRLAAEVDFHSLDIEHLISFARAPDAAWVHLLRAIRPAAGWNEWSFREGPP